MCGISLFLTSENIYQQTRAGHHPNQLEQDITTSFLWYSCQKHILNFPHQKKTTNHSQDNSDFILVNITPSTNQKHQNMMSNLLHTQILTMDLTLLFIFLCHEPQNRRTWTKISRPFDILYAWQRRNSSTIIPQISSYQK